jgi:hypothetical protein
MRSADDRTRGVVTFSNPRQLEERCSREQVQYRQQWVNKAPFFVWKDRVACDCAENGAAQSAHDVALLKAIGGVCRPTKVHVYTLQGERQLSHEQDRHCLGEIEV